MNLELTPIANQVIEFLCQFKDNEYHNIQEIIKDLEDLDIIDILNELIENQLATFKNYNSTLHGFANEGADAELIKLPSPIEGKLTEKGLSLCNR